MAYARDTSRFHHRERRPFFFFFIIIIQLIVTEREWQFHSNNAMRQLTLKNVQIESLRSLSSATRDLRGVNIAATLNRTTMCNACAIGYLRSAILLFKQHQQQQPEWVFALQLIVLHTNHYLQTNQISESNFILLLLVLLILTICEIKIAWMNSLLRIT